MVRAGAIRVVFQMLNSTFVKTFENLADTEGVGTLRGGWTYQSQAQQNPVKNRGILRRNILLFLSKSQTRESKISQIIAR